MRHYVYIRGDGKQLASSIDVTEEQAKELAQELANDNNDVVEYCWSYGRTAVAVPEVLS